MSFKNDCLLKQISRAQLNIWISPPSSHSNPISTYVRSWINNSPGFCSPPSPVCVWNVISNDKDYLIFANWQTSFEFDSQLTVDILCLVFIFVQTKTILHIYRELTNDHSNVTFFRPDIVGDPLLSAKIYQMPYSLYQNQLIQKLQNLITMLNPPC